MDVFAVREVLLKHLAYRYWRKDKLRDADGNWYLAEKLLCKIEKRYERYHKNIPKKQLTLWRRIINKFKRRSI